MRAAKLGLIDYNHELYQGLDSLLQLAETDMTIFYRRLANVDIENDTLNDAQLFAPLMEAYYSPEALSSEINNNSTFGYVNINK